MQKSRIKKSVEKLEQTLDQFQSFYTQAINKSTQFLSLIKNNIEKFYQIDIKSFNRQNIKIKVLQSYIKFWKAGANQFANLEIDVLTYDGIKKGYIDAINEYKDMHKKLKNVNRQMRELKHLQERIQQQVRIFNDPIIFYNISEKIKHKRLIGEMFGSYKNHKQIISQRQNRRVRYWKHLEKSSEQFLKFNYSLQKFTQQIEITINQFYASLLQSLKKQLKKVEASQFQFQFITDKQQFKKYHIAILSKVKSLTKQQTQHFYVKSWNFVKLLAKSHEDSLKLNYFFQQYCRMIIDRCSLLKKQIQNQLRQLANIQIDIKDPLYNKNYNFIRSYKAIIHSMINFCDQTIKIKKQNLTFVTNLKQLYQRKNVTIQSLKKIVNKTTSIDPKKLVELYQIINQDLSVLQNIQKQQNNKVKQFYKTLVEKFHHQINISKSSLKTYQQKQKTQNEQKSTEMQNLIKKKFCLQQQGFGVIDWNIKFQEQIIKILDHQQQKPEISEDDRQNQKVYSCALGGKLLLAGKLKIYKDKFCFFSSFNKKNIFFGDTQIFVKKQDIIDVKKDNLMLLNNSIQIQTKKGNIVFTSLFSRDKVFAEINAIIQNNQGQIQPEIVQQKTIMSQLPDPDQLRLILEKSGKYNKKLFDRYPIQIFTIDLLGMGIKKYFRQFWDNNQIKIKKKKFQNFKTFYLSQIQNIQIQCNEWNPPPPTFYARNSATKFSTTQFSQRQITYKHELPPLPIPFLPKYGDCRQKQKIYWISTKQFIVQTQNFMTGAPYSDSFVIFVKYLIKQEQQSNNVKIDTTAQIRFVKNTAFERVLRSAAQKQLQTFSKNVKNLIIDQIKRIEQRKLRRMNKKDEGQLQGQKQEVNEDQGVNEVQVLKNKVKQLEQRYKKHGIGIIIIFLIVLILSHILI